VILLHGFPDDVRAYDDVVPPLVKAGYRALVPYPARLWAHSLPRRRRAAHGAAGCHRAGRLDFADALG
jgi:hypothetical protein